MTITFPLVRSPSTALPRFIPPCCRCLVSFIFSFGNCANLGLITNYRWLYLAHTLQLITRRQPDLLDTRTIHVAFYICHCLATDDAYVAAGMCLLSPDDTFCFLLKSKHHQSHNRINQVPALIDFIDYGCVIAACAYCLWPPTTTCCFIQLRRQSCTQPINC